MIRFDRKVLCEEACPFCSALSWPRLS